MSDLDKRLRAIYSRANRELTEKVNSFFERFEEADKKHRALVEEGKLSEKEYQKWRINTLMTGERYKQMQKDVADTLLNVNKVAASYINAEMPGVYASNFNRVGKDASKQVPGYSFDLVSAQTVRKLASEDKTLLPYKYVDGRKDERWNTKKVNGEILQGIIQGESIPNIAKRLRNVTEMNKESAIRNARTAITGAQNSGRFDGMKQLEDDGVILKKEWVAAVDSHTREAHLELNGQQVDVDEPFHNSIGDIMYPGDPSADPANVYNCRCTMRTIVVGFRKRENNKDWEIEQNETREEKRKEEEISSYDAERRIYDKISAMNYDATAGDIITLSESGREQKGDKWVPFSRETGQIIVPENQSNTDVMIFTLPSGKESFYGQDSTKNAIMTNGRIAINSSTARTETRAKVTDMIENEIATLGGIREDGIFWRVTSNPKDEEYIRTGKIKPSKNHMTGKYEDGLSVWERPKYYDKYIERLTGEVVGIGSDGEPLLDVKTVKIVELTGKKIKEMEKEGRKKFCELYGWTEEQLDKALQGKYSIRR